MARALAFEAAAAKRAAREERQHAAATRRQLGEARRGFHGGGGGGDQRLPAIYDSPGGGGGGASSSSAGLLNDPVLRRAREMCSGANQVVAQLEEQNRAMLAALSRPAAPARAPMATPQRAAGGVSASRGAPPAPQQPPSHFAFVSAEEAELVARANALLSDYTPPDQQPRKPGVAPQQPKKAAASSGYGGGGGGAATAKAHSTTRSFAIAAPPPGMDDDGAALLARARMLCDSTNGLH